MYIFSAGQRYNDSSIDELTINILNGCTFTIMLGTIIHCITADGNIKWPRLVSATPEIQTRWKRFSWVLSLPTFTRAPTVCRNQSACLSASSPADRPPGVGYKANTVRFRRPLKGLESQYVTLLRSRNFWCSHKNQLHGHWLSLYTWSHHIDIYLLAAIWSNFKVVPSSIIGSKRDSLGFCCYLHRPPGSQL